ncbi:DUF1624 domain-containing protein [Brevibacterium moorei]|uniref:DUF1624 domain-containing protein n=1 Tax=Brevibacterium moorei TaxID=2968457 RepID=UPI00211C8107|nr:DUF1624 domain-containing protein [Brevibacterium sp. 68QC2CO]MCQ9384984.1 DUF1624 domain-containing protein [Brevibacterium sp. 68QC2CO]
MSRADPPVRTSPAFRLAPPGRDLGVDLARGLALFAMFATHILPLAGADGQPAFAGHFAGRASALFAVLAGCSIVLSTRRPLGAGRFGQAAAGLVVRGVIIVIIGLALGEVTSFLAIILSVYGLMFVLAAAFLPAPTWLLGVLAPVWLTVSPVLSFLIRRSLGLAADHRVPDLTSALHPGELFTAIALTGYYPALQWFGYVLAGMFVARLFCGDPHRGTDSRQHGLTIDAALVAAGAVLALVARGLSALLLPLARPALEASLAGRQRDLAQILVEGNFGLTPTDSWWWLTICAPHSGTPFDLLHTAGAALAVLGLCRLIARGLKRPGIGRQGAGPSLILAPVTAPGSMPLSMYAIHVVVLEITAAAGLAAWPEYATHLLLLAAVAILWRAWVAPRGPLESLIHIAVLPVRALSR